MGWEEGVVGAMQKRRKGEKEEIRTGEEKKKGNTGGNKSVRKKGK